MKHRIVKICLVLACLLSIVYAGTAYYMMKQVTEPQVGSTEEIRESLLHKHKVDFAKLSLETEMLTTSDGMRIETEVYRNPKRTGNVVVLSHGIRQSGEMMLQFFPMYEALGFDIVTFSYRNHGKSSKSATTFGKYEVNDLKAVMDYTHNKFGNEAKYTIHGISMGSAIMLQYAHQYKENKQYDYLISDCSFADLEKLLNTRLQIEYAPLSFLPLVKTASLISNGIGRMDFSSIVPQNDVKYIDAPTLFIHGEKDDYIPIEHAYDLYNAKLDKKELVVMKNGKHAESYLYNKDVYEEAVRTFYKNNL